MNLLIHIMKGARSVEPENIIYCESDANYTKIYFNILTINDKECFFVSTKSLKQLTELLTGVAFYRCHKSYLINFKYFHEFDVSTNSIIMTNGKIIKIAKAKKNESKKQLLKYFEIST